MKFLKFALIILMNCRKGCSVLPDAKTTAEVTKAIADWYGLTCAVIYHDSTPGMTDAIFQILKVIFQDLKAIAVRDLETYARRVSYRYDRQRCSEMLHVIHGEVDVWMAIEKLSYSVNMGGPVWMVFLPNTTTTEEFLWNANIPFNAEFITGQLHGGAVTLSQAYRVSMDYPLRVKLLGSWTPDIGLFINSGYKPRWRRENMEGRVFRVSGLESWPITMVNRNNVLEGYFGAVWRELEQRLNFSTMYVKPRDRATGIWNGKQWNGLIGMIVDGEVDAAVSEVTMTPDRLPVVDFLKPLFTTRYQLFFKTPGLMIEWDLILRPFRTEVWITLLFWLGLLTVVLVGGYRIGLTYGLEDSNYMQEYRSFNCLFFVLAAFIQQGNSQMPKSTPCRLTLIIAYVFSSVLVIIYSCTLTSMIAVERLSRPFDSLESFLEDGTYMLEQIPGSDSYSYFSNSTDQVLRQIYERHFSQQFDELPQTHMAAMDRVCTKRRTAHMGEFGIARIAAERMTEIKGCPILYLEKPLKLLYLTIAISKDNPYRDSLDYHLGQMAVTGILKRFLNGNFPLPSKPKKISSHQPVAVEQIAQINVLLLMGLTTAVCIFFGEVVVRKWAGYGDAVLHRKTGGKFSGLVEPYAFVYDSGGKHTDKSSVATCYQ